MKQTTDRQCHRFDREAAIEMAIETIRSMDDGDLACYLAECNPGDVVQVDDEVRIYNEKTRRTHDASDDGYLLQCASCGQAGYAHYFVNTGAETLCVDCA